MNYESGTVKNVHYGDVLIKFGDYIDASETELPYISDDAKADKFKNSFLQDGDIIIADTAEDDTVGKCTEIQGSEGLKLLSGLHTIACRPKEKFGPMFLGYYINSPAYHNQLKPLMQGIKVTSISKSALQDTDMIMPKSIDEQIKIGEYFSNLDNLITLHQCEYFVPFTMPIQNKKSYFPTSWEQRKLGELAEIKDSARIPNAEWSDFGVPYIRASDITNEDASGVLFISHERYEFYKNKTGAPAKGDVLFNGGGEIGKTMLNSSDSPIYVQGGAVLYARTSVADSLEGQYLKTYFETPNAQHYFETASAGGTMKHFTLKPSQEMPIKLPQVEEQKKIGECFSDIDNLITLHQRELI